MIPRFLLADHSLRSAIQLRLKQNVTEIVDRCRTAGEVLTWRLMHTIEDEAFKRLEATGAFDEEYLDMLHSSCVPKSYPNNDMIVDLKESNALPTAFGLIIDAYRMSH